VKRVNKILSNVEFKSCLQTIEDFERERIFCKHGLTHLLDVARISYILNLESGLNVPKEIIYATTLLHDIGRYDQYMYNIPHNQAKNRIVNILSSCEYSTEEINTIVDAIQKHQKQSNQLKTLADILYKADKLSRLCFNCDAENRCYWNDDTKNKDLIL